MFRCVTILTALALTACAPIVHPAGPDVMEPVLADDTLTMADGSTLDLHVWPASGYEHAIILALHGFNDYGNAFALPAEIWSKRGITTYAYDQRGFGNSVIAGYWAGSPTLVRDVETTVELLARRHLGVPVFLLGESMGGALAALASVELRAIKPDGLVLVAPAVWGLDTMPWSYRASLWLVAHVAPGAKLSGSGLDIWPSDNIEMLRALGQDPLVIKETRADATLGLVRLMDQGLSAASGITVPTLLVYGARDDIIPAEPVERFALAVQAPLVVTLYEQGYHMAMRDLGRDLPVNDIADFVLGADQMTTSDHAVSAENLLESVRSIRESVPASTESL